MEEISELKREGLSIQAISQLTGFDRKTIRKYLLKPEGRPMYGPRSAPVSKLEPFKPYLKERLQAGVWNAQVLLRELRQRNYSGGYTILTDWLRPQRESARVVAVGRFETPPGKQAQVDWGHLGSLLESGEDAASIPALSGCFTIRRRSPPSCELGGARQPNVHASAERLRTLPQERGREPFSAKQGSDVGQGEKGRLRK